MASCHGAKNFYLDLPCPVTGTDRPFRRMLSTASRLACSLSEFSDFPSLLDQLDDQRRTLSDLTQLTRIGLFPGFSHISEGMSQSMCATLIDRERPADRQQQSIFHAIYTTAAKYYENLVRLNESLWRLMWLYSADTREECGSRPIPPEWCVQVCSMSRVATDSTSIVSGGGGLGISPSAVDSSSSSRAITSVEDPLRSNRTRVSSSSHERREMSHAPPPPSDANSTSEPMSISPGWEWSPSVHLNEDWATCIDCPTLGSLLDHHSIECEIYLARVLQVMAVYNYATSLREGRLHLVSIGRPVSIISLDQELETRMESAMKLYRMTELLLTRLAHHRQWIDAHLHSLSRSIQEATEPHLVLLKCLSTAGRMSIQHTLAWKQAQNSYLVFKGEEDTHSLQRVISDPEYPSCLRILDRLAAWAYRVCECYTSACLHLTADVRSVATHSLLAVQCNIAKRHYAGLVFRYLTESAFLRGRQQAALADQPPPPTSDYLCAAFVFGQLAQFNLGIAIDVDKTVLKGNCSAGKTGSNKLLTRYIFPLLDKITLRMSVETHGHYQEILNPETQPTPAAVAQTCLFGSQLSQFIEPVLRTVLHEGV